CPPMAKKVLPKNMGWCVLRHGFKPTNMMNERYFGTLGLFAAALFSASAGLHSSALAAASTKDSTPARAQLLERYGTVPLSFELNQGQADSSIRFLSRGPGYSLFL